MNNKVWGNLVQNCLEKIWTVPRRIECPNTRQSLRQLLVNEEMLGMFMNSRMWASVHLDRGRDPFQRVLRNVDVDVIQQMVSTTQNQIQSLPERDLSGLQGQLDWDPNPWKSVFADSVLCLGGKSVLCLFEKSPENP